ncbi:MAG TPA: DUF2917 domain-containing protein [Anaeromyxobacteraceae bacterium]|nr:DUF2917 domain-containing protein [Anaeromyxobacteraceae bacterium]
MTGFWHHSARARRARSSKQDATIQLPPGPRGLLVRVERGVLLVTQEGDLDDHVLEPAQELRIPRGGLAVGWALAPATVVIADAASASGRSR